MRQYWMKIHALAVFSLLPGLNAYGNAQTSGAHVVPVSVKLDPARCISVTAQQRTWLGTEWQPFLTFVKACRVRRDDPANLFVISVWEDDYEAQLPKDAPAPKYPKPLIVTKDGKVLGRLPLGFPRDPPRSSDLTFTKWSDGFPHRIRLEIDDPTVIGNSRLLLEWDAQSNSFIQSGKKP